MYYNYPQDIHTFVLVCTIKSPLGLISVHIHAQIINVIHILLLSFGHYLHFSSYVSVMIGTNSWEKISQISGLRVYQFVK